MNYKRFKSSFFLVSILKIFFIIGVHADDDLIKVGGFNSGGGYNKNTIYNNHFSFGDSFSYQIKKSNKFSLSSGLINTLDNTSFKNNRIIFDQSIFGLEDNSVQIILSGIEGVTDFEIIVRPSHGKLTGTPPNLVYEPDSDFYGEDFFTFNGLYKGEETKSGIIRLYIENVNDKPIVNLTDTFKDLTEDIDSLITLKEIQQAISITDPDNVKFKIKIIEVGEGEIFVDGKKISNDYIIEDSTELLFRPNANRFGEINIFKIQVSDDNLKSDPLWINTIVNPVEDLPFIQNPIEDINLSENEELQFDISDVFYDPDGTEIDYFISNNSNESLMAPEILDNKILNINLSDGISGISEIQIGGESDGDLIYYSFLITVNSVDDSNPFVVNDYWKGMYNGVQVEVNLGKPGNEPKRVWSFKSKENINKSISGNWVFENSENEANISEEPLISINNNIFDNIYFKSGQSIRIQEDTTLDLIVPTNKEDDDKKGADWEKRNNYYTVIFDLRMKYGLDNPLFNTQYPNLKADSWLYSFGSVGGQGKVSESASVLPDTFYRLSLVVNGKDSTVKYYLNEKLLLSNKIDDMIDGGFSLGKSFSIGLDDFIEDKNFELRRVVYYDYALNSSQINFLGLMSIEEFKIENNRFQVTDETKIYLKRENLSTINQLNLFIITKEDSSNWNIETSSNLDTWNTIGILNTREMDNLDEKYRIGEFMIDNIKKKKKEFVRIRSID